MTDDRWGRGGHETIGGPPAMVTWSAPSAPTSGFDGFLQFYLFIAHRELCGPGHGTSFPVSQTQSHKLRKVL